MSSYYEGKRPEIFSLIESQPKKVLELGCGDGGFRNLLSKDCEYWGIEPFAEAAMLAEKRLDKVFCNTYESVLSSLPDGYFDLVVCNDVIEHLVDHDFFFSSIKAKINDGGCIVGSVPNVRHFSNIIHMILHKDWCYQDKGILDRTHLRFFTEKSLVRTFKSNGYELERFKYISNLKLRFHPPKRFFLNLLVFLLGKDTRAVQFGFRIRVNKKISLES